jgi:large subunit ribosomal protein L29
MAKAAEVRAQLRDLSVEDLRAKERELDEEVFRLRIQKATASLEQTSKVKAARRDLARVKTILRQKAS